ncbi:MAG: nucleoside-diphosphate kinase [Chloroflexota bacterium]
MEKTLVIIKPDGVQRGLIGKIISRLEKRGLRIVGLKMLQADTALAERHYAVHKGKPFFAALVNFITSGPVVTVVLEGDKAIEIVRRTMGDTDCAKASPGSIRGDLGVDITHNLIHGSDSPETAASEIALFFSRTELIDYSRVVDRWVGLARN